MEKKIFLSGSISPIQVVSKSDQLMFTVNIIGFVILGKTRMKALIKVNRLNTRFGKIIEGTDFAEYAIKNKFVLDNKTFIARKGATAQYYLTFIYKGESFGIWIDYNEGRFFVSQDVDPSCKIVYSITVDDHAPNTLLLSNINKAVFWRKFIDNYKQGNVYFENQKIKGICSTT